MVQVTFKTISQQSFTLDVDPEKTVGDLKTSVESDKGADFPADQMKLIYNGKVLEDPTKFSDVGYDDKKFIVVMVLKKKAPPAEPTATPVEKPATVAVETSSPPATPVAAETTTVQAPTAPAPAAAAAAAVAAPAAEVALTAEQETAVEAVMGMGYPKDQVVAALKAAFWNADRAVEYLLSGIPDNAAVAVAAEADVGGEALNESMEAEGEEGNPMQYLAQLPQFQEIRNMIRNNPQMMGALLQQMATQNPELAQLIQQDPNGFFNLLNSDAPAAGGGGGGGQGADIVAEGGNQPARAIIRLTADENQAVERLTAMGFPQQLVLEAYIACDKNEEQAVNYILSRMDEDYADT